MELISRVLKYLFWLLVVAWSVALLRRVVAWMIKGAASESARAAGAAAGAGAPSGLATRRLVRDPVCGTHVAEELAIPMRDSGELVHFCSPECRDQYAAKVQRKAANG